MKLVKTNRVCIYFKTGEITQRIAYDGGECSVSNFIYTHSKEHFVGTFKIEERRMKQLFYIKGIESIYPKLKVADFVKVRRGVLVMHYCGDKAFYRSLHGRDIVRVTLDECRILSYEGSFHLQWKIFSFQELKHQLEHNPNLPKETIPRCGSSTCPIAYLIKPVFICSKMKHILFKSTEPSFLTPCRVYK